MDNKFVFVLLLAVIIGSGFLYINKPPQILTTTQTTTQHLTETRASTTCTSIQSILLTSTTTITHSTTCTSVWSEP